MRACLLCFAEPVEREESQQAHWLHSPLLSRGLPLQLDSKHPLMHPFFGLGNVPTSDAEARRRDAAFLNDLTESVTDPADLNDLNAASLASRPATRLHAYLLRSTPELLARAPSSPFVEKAARALLASLLSYNGLVAEAFRAADALAANAEIAQAAAPQLPKPGPESSSIASSPSERKAMAEVSDASASDGTANARPSARRQSGGTWEEGRGGAAGIDWSSLRSQWLSAYDVFRQMNEAYRRTLSADSRVTDAGEGLLQLARFVLLVAQQHTLGASRSASASSLSAAAPSDNDDADNVDLQQLGASLGSNVRKLFHSARHAASPAFAHPSSSAGPGAQSGTWTAAGRRAEQDVVELVASRASTSQLRSLVILQQKRALPRAQRVTTLLASFSASPRAIRGCSASCLPTSSPCSSRRQRTRRRAAARSGSRATIRVTCSALAHTRSAGCASRLPRSWASSCDSQPTMAAQRAQRAGRALLLAAAAEGVEKDRAHCSDSPGVGDALPASHGAEARRPGGAIGDWASACAQRRRGEAPWLGKQQRRHGRR